MKGAEATPPPQCHSSAPVSVPVAKFSGKLGSWEAGKFEACLFSALQETDPLKGVVRRAEEAGQNYVENGKKKDN